MIVPPGPITPCTSAEPTPLPPTSPLTSNDSDSYFSSQVPPSTADDPAEGHENRPVPPFPSEIWHQILDHLSPLLCSSSRPTTYPSLLLRLRTLSHKFHTITNSLLAETITGIIPFFRESRPCCLNQPPTPHQEKKKSPKPHICPTPSADDRGEDAMSWWNVETYAPRFVRLGSVGASCADEGKEADRGGRVGGKGGGVGSIAVFVAESFTTYPVERGDRLFYTHESVEEDLLDAAAVAFSTLKNESDDPRAGTRKKDDALEEAKEEQGVEKAREISCLFNFRTLWRRGILPPSTVFDRHTRTLKVDTLELVRMNLQRGGEERAVNCAAESNT